MSDLTVFVGTYNRTDTLKRCIRNLEAQDYPKRIVIVDNGSRDERAISYLDELSSTYRVYRMPAIEDMPVLPGGTPHGGHGMNAVQRNYSEAFRVEYEQNPTRWFAVCDCDTAPDGPRIALGLYVYLAEELGVAVGPHLNLNVHLNYPLRSCALILNARVLFKDQMLWRDGLPYTHDPIDSSFHLFPAEPSFRRLEMQAIRVGAPFWATHTDWEIDVLNPTAENHAYILGAGEAASWGGGWIREWFRAWLRSPEEAYAVVEYGPANLNDYSHELFILSWMLQYGHGCEQDLERSRDLLRGAVPLHSPTWEYEQHWDALVYENDQSFLGWE